MSMFLTVVILKLTVIFKSWHSDIIPGSDNFRNEKDSSPYKV